MESQDQVSASDKSVSEMIKGIEMQIRDSSDTLPSERNDSGSVTENLEEIKHKSDDVGCMPTSDKDKDISSTESSNIIADSKSEAAQEESRNVSVENKESLCVLTESSNMSANKEISDTIQAEISDKLPEKDLSQTKSTEASTGGEKSETTSSFSISSFDDKALCRTNILASCDNLSQQSSDERNVSKYTEIAIQTLNSGTAVEVSQVESLQSLCVRQKHTECENLKVNADSVSEKKETHGKGESISPDKLQTSTSANKTASIESDTIKKSTSDVETTALKNSNGTAGTTEISSEENVIDEQSSIPSETACEENITCKISGATTKKATYSYIVSKDSTDMPETVGGNVTKEHSNVAAKIENLQLKQDKKVTNEQLPTAKTAVCETVSNETAGVCTSEAEQQPGETEDDGERRAFFYMSSCSVPGMGEGWEWPTVSSEHHYQRIPRRRECRRNTAESRNCLGTQRCHYIILAIGVLGAILGCLTYHLQDYGIGPKVLRPIGASAAFLSFVVCAFSSVYLTYLSYYTQSGVSYNYQPLSVSDPAASMLIDTMPQGYNSDPTFYFTASAAATSQQVFRETQSADALDRRGYSWHQSDIKRPFGEPGPSGYDPDSKRFKMDPKTREGEVYEMKSMRRTSEKDQCKERNPSQASDSSHYTMADQAFQSHSSGESENDEKTPLLPKK